MSYHYENRPLFLTQIKEIVNFEGEVAELRN